MDEEVGNGFWGGRPDVDLHGGRREVNVDDAFCVLVELGK